MWTTTHVLAYYLKALRAFEQLSKNRKIAVKEAEEYLKKNIATLILPDVLGQYAPRRQFHFNESPNGEVSNITFITNPDDLKDIRHKYVADLKPSPRDCAVRGTYHPEWFSVINPGWESTAYSVHLYQDYAWDRCMQEMVDYSQRFSDKIVYRNTGKVVDGSTFHNKVTLINEVVFKKISRRIYEEFGTTTDKKWFKNTVYPILSREYDVQTANDALEIMKFPKSKPKVEIPEFVPEGEIDVIVVKIIASTFLN